MCWYNKSEEIHQWRDTFITHKDQNLQIFVLDSDLGIFFDYLIAFSVLDGRQKTFGPFYIQYTMDLILLSKQKLANLHLFLPYRASLVTCDKRQIAFILILLCDQYEQFSV